MDRLKFERQMQDYERFGRIYRPEQQDDGWWLASFISCLKAPEGETRTERKNRLCRLVLHIVVPIGAYIGFNALLTAWMMGAW